MEGARNLPFFDKSGEVLSENLFRQLPTIYQKINIKISQSLKNISSLRLIIYSALAADINDFVEAFLQRSIFKYLIQFIQKRLTRCQPF
jgi:hypothetical protein